ncbi:MAG: glutamate--tRNA ligase, partial [Thermoproteota archaeon]
MDDELKRLVRKVALQNAFEHDGQTRDKIVLSKILGTRPELRNKIKEITAEISAIVSDVNKISLQQQQSEIERNFPELLAAKEKIEERAGLPPLEDAENGKVVTRFP